MLNHKKFIDIEQFKTKYSDCFKVGDIIQISEKVDGSNASMQYDKNENIVQSFSRNMVLTPENSLNGFYGYAQKMICFEKYSDYRFFGEWNLNHLVKYPQEEIKKFHCFDIYDTVNEKWMPQDFVVSVCKELNVEMVPIFYYGEFISWEHIAGFVGKTKIGLKNGEGCVIKNMTTLNNPNTRIPFVVKMVAPEYLETAQRKVKEPISQEELEICRYNNELTDTIVTENRVEKCLYKLIMENLIPEDWDEKSMGLIAKQVPTAVYRDCVKEENEVVEKVENFGRLCSSHTMQIIRKMLLER